METNGIQNIIRIRTRMMACVWLVLSSCLAFMHPFDTPAISAVCMAFSYYLLFRCYQLYDATAWIFHSFLFLGIGSLFSAVMLPMGLLFYIYLIIFLRSLSWRGFWAGILGLAIPYLGWGAWSFLMDKTDGMFSFIISHFKWHSISWETITCLPVNRMISMGTVILLSLVGVIHYLHTKYNDKIRVRMILYIYTLQTILLILYLFLQPQEFQNTMALLVVSACPIIAHFFSLTKSRMSNAFFILSIFLCATMAYFNLWMNL